MNEHCHSKEDDDEPVSKWFVLALLAIVVAVFYLLATKPITDAKRSAYILRMHH